MPQFELHKQKLRKIERQKRQKSFLQFCLSVASSFRKYLLVSRLTFVIIPLIDLFSFCLADITMAAPVVIAATVKHTGTLIFFHGLGDTGQGWASAMASIRPPHVKVICPTAPTMPVTLNAGFRMPSWFDLKTLDANGPEDEAGILSATKQVHGMIESEIHAGIHPENILLGGFSQGGALALYSALTYNQTLAGVVSLSCWLPLHKSFPAAMKCSDNLSVLQCHGDCDPVVPYKWGQMTASLLKTLIKNAEFKTYRGLMHTSSEEELSDVKDFIHGRLKN